MQPPYSLTIAQLMEATSPGLTVTGGEPPLAPAAGVSTPVAASSTRSAPASSAMQQQQHEDEEYLFELAPLGPADLLSRCREGPGNWWGEGNEEDLRVDAKGRVVLVDPEMYFEVRGRQCVDYCIHM